MIKLLFIVIAIALIELVAVIFFAKRSIKANAEKKKYEQLYDNLKSSMSKIEENIANANEEKAKLNTGDSVTDINNAADILHKYAQKRKSKD